ncbi:histidine kinase [Komagataeibacter xylinus]|nr:histidine kinase [Komagataeibacter xylinus]
MTTPQHFRVSSHLKDIIGQDLVTNEFVAVFELVKNSFDARARRVDIVFDNNHNEIWIVDDGKGMNETGIKDRWLFVAYSAKADGSETERTSSDYRDRIKPSGQFAGSKGIGRFSCDTLGGVLRMSTRTSLREAVQVLTVEWRKFELDNKQLFQRIGVELEQADRFPEDAPITMPQDSGTVLRIGDLRSDWDFEKINKLRRYLGKLIDPFGTTEDTPVHVTVVDNRWNRESIGALSGPIGNDIRNLLAEKTTRIVVNVEGEAIQTQLFDRGRLIYRIKENNSYQGLQNASVAMEIFYLNRAAKHNFKLQMGVRSVEFGSIFLFLNGFRIFPIGEENDDTLGLNRRKQQGSSRYLGTRDVLGRVDVTAPMGMFREASSRDAGLIDDARVRDLYDAIRRKAVVRLERFVVGVMWPDKADQWREDASGFEQVSTRSRAAQLVAQLAANAAVEIEYYDPDIVDIFDAEAEALDTALESLVSIAESQGDRSLLSRVEAARARQEALEQSEREAVEAARQAMAATARANERIALLERQATYLASTQDMTVEQMALLLHQVLIYAGHIGAALDRGLRNLREASEAAQEIEGCEEDEDLAAAAAATRHHTKLAMNDLEYIHLENDRLMAVARFASNARFDLETDLLEGDILEFLDEYVNQVRVDRDGVESVSFDANGLSQLAKFPPVDLVVIVDNLMDNARKHGARQMKLKARRNRRGRIEIEVSDDGRGMDEDRVDPTKLFDKGYSSTDGGTGLGLFHVRQVLHKMGGDIALDSNRERGRVDFIITLPGEEK